MPLVVLAGLAQDRGIFNEFNDQVTLEVHEIDRSRTWMRDDPVHGISTLYEGDDPVLVSEKSTNVRAFLAVGARIAPGPPPRSIDHDGDGIVDRLDILLGAKKLLLNQARYIERYVAMKYPMGDVPRSEGVCTDTVIRALRNAGIDLQKEVHEDILRSPKSYPMVEKVDTNINHRRVRTIVVWFHRHFRELPESAPYKPGDIVFFDTFPSKPGPDHLGIVSDRLGPSKKPLIINNWTDGTVDAEMDLLPTIPVTHHFRAP